MEGLDEGEEGEFECAADVGLSCARLMIWKEMFENRVPQVYTIHDDSSIDCVKSREWLMLSCGHTDRNRCSALMAGRHHMQLDNREFYCQYKF